MANGVSSTQGMFMLIAFLVSMYITKLVIEYMFPTLDFMWVFIASFGMAIFITYGILSEISI